MMIDEHVKPYLQVYDATLEEKAKAWADICNVSASDPNTVTILSVVDMVTKNGEFSKLFVQLELFQDDENKRLRAMKKSSEQKVEAGITGPLPQYIFHWYRNTEYLHLLKHLHTTRIFFQV